MKTEQVNIGIYGINENAYLSEEEEREVVSLAIKNMLGRNMDYQERENYLQKFPIPKMFAPAYKRILSEEEFCLLEEKNIQLIKTRAWENE